MNRSLVLAFGIGVAVATSSAHAEDATPRSNMTSRQAMKDCIEQQKGLEVSQSKSQMKRICKDKLKAQKDAGDLPAQPPADAPRP